MCIIVTNFEYNSLSQGCGENNLVSNMTPGVRVMWRNAGGGISSFQPTRVQTSTSPPQLQGVHMATVRLNLCTGLDAGIKETCEVINVMDTVWCWGTHREREVQQCTLGRPGASSAPHCCCQTRPQHGPLSASAAGPLLLQPRMADPRPTSWSQAP